MRSVLGSVVDRYVPIAGWLRSYDRAWLRPDVIAGLTVWALLVPEAMAYATLAGVPPEAGLYAALPPLMLYAVFGTSRQVSVGPSSAVAVMVAATVGPLAGGDGERYVALAAAMAVLVGLILIVAAIARLGFVSEFMAKPVLTGFIIGLALVIAAGQVDKLFGIHAEGEGFFAIIWDIIINLGDTHLETLLVGSGCLVLLFGLKRFAPRAPAALITVALSIIAVALFDLEGRGVHIVGDIPAGLPPLKIPDIGLADFQDLLPGALGLALVAYAESIAPARSFAARDKYEVDANQELLALGASNIGVGLSQGFAVDASLSRSAVNDYAGAKTQVAGLVNAGLIFVTILALTPLFHDLPDAALAAVVISAVAHLVDVKELERLYRLKKEDFWLAAICMMGVLVVDVLPGLIIAVTVSLLALVHRASRPLTAVLGRVSDQDTFRDIERHPEGETYPGLVIFRFEAELFFANAGYFRDRIRELMAVTDPPAQAVLVDAEAIQYIDTTAVAVLQELQEELADSGVELLMARVHGGVRDMLRRSGLEESLGASRIYPSVRAGVADYLDHHGSAGGTAGATDRPRGPT
jgi:SulP family sulfate permease